MNNLERRAIQALITRLEQMGFGEGNSERDLEDHALLFTARVAIDRDSAFRELLRPQPVEFRP